MAEDLSPRDWQRIGVAAAVQPIVASVMAAVAHPLFYPQFYGHDPRIRVGAIGLPLPARIALAVGIACVPLSLVGTGAALGIRALSGRLTLLHVLVIGIVVGNLPLVFFETLQQAAYVRQGIGVQLARLWTPATLAPVAFGAMLGIACAVCFWLIVGTQLRESAKGRCE